MELYKQRVMNEMNTIRLDEIEKEIVRQMGVETICEAMLIGDWEKVDPEISKPYQGFVASRISETFRSMDKGTSSEIRAKIEASDPTKAFLLIDDP